MTYLHPVLLLVLFLLALGLAGFRRSWRWRNRLVTLATVLLFLWSWAPVAQLSSGTLERWYPATSFPVGQARALVVLSANVLEPNPTQPRAEPDLSTYLRTSHAAWLYHHWKPLPIVTSGGPIGPPDNRVVAAKVMKRLLVSDGVPADMVWIEGHSHSTWQNAVYSCRLLREHGIHEVAVVTEGYHMLRAEACFRKQGFVVTPAPCCFYTLRPPRSWTAFLPDDQSMHINENVLHEWVGLAWYWLLGRV